MTERTPFVDTMLIPMAGEGTGMSGYTGNFPKAALPMLMSDGRMATVLDRTLEDPIRLGFKNFVLVVNPYNRGDVERIISNHGNPQRRTNLAVLGKSDVNAYEQALRDRYADLNFVLVDQPPQQEGKAPDYGTLLPPLSARSALAGVRKFVVWGGDDILVQPNGEQSDLERALMQWQAAGTPHLIAGRPIPRSDASNYGVLEFDDSGRFTGILEKPSNPPEDPLCNISRYGFSDTIWTSIDAIRNAPLPTGQENYRVSEYRITDAIGHAALNGGAFTVYRVSPDTAYLDTGNPDRYIDALMTVRDLQKP